MEISTISLIDFRKKLLTYCYLFSLNSENRLVDLDHVKNEYNIKDENDWTKASIDYFQSKKYIGIPLIMNGNLVSIGGNVPIFATAVSDRFSFTEAGKSYAKELLKNAISSIDHFGHVPASDRIVSLSDNQQSELESKTTQIISEIEKFNGIDGDATFRQIVLGQLKAGRELIRAAVFDAGIMYLTLAQTLKMLVKRYDQAVIGSLAGALLVELAKIHGLLS